MQPYGRPSFESSGVSSGELFFRYRIERCLGRGGMGEVYEAFDTRLRRSVALKILTTAGDASQVDVRRLLVEARSLAALQHRNIVTVYDVGEHGNVPYLTMELLRGRSLANIAKAGEGSRTERLRWLLEIASALATVHRAGLVHRDVKPGNVMVTEDGRAVLFDFGIARPADPGFGTFDGQSVRGGMVIGTPRYMAPELTTGTRASAGTDQYAWGIIAAQLLTGDKPSTDWDIPRALAAASVAEPLASLVLRACDRFAGHRFQSMDEIVAALEPLTRAPSRPPKRRTSLPVLVVAGVSLLVGAVGGAILSARSTHVRRDAGSTPAPVVSVTPAAASVTAAATASETTTPLVPLSAEPVVAPSASASVSIAPSATTVHRFVPATPQNECSVDADCGCGVEKSTGACAVGPLKRIDTQRRCPDFCEGFEGNMVTACRAGRCVKTRSAE